MVRFSWSVRWRTRLILIAGLAALITASAVIMAVAGSDPAATFSAQTPADGSRIAVDKPVISVNMYNGGTLNVETAALKIDGTAVAAQLSGTSPDYTLSYVPAQALADGEHTVTAAVYDNISGLISADWKFTVGIGPVLTGLTPAPGSSVTTGTPVIGFTAEDRDGVNGSSVQVKVNGKTVPASVTFPETGYWAQEYDTCTGEPYSYWVRTGYDYTKATVRTNPVSVPDSSTIWVSIADQKGNASTREWTFRTPLPPVISAMTPANNALVNNPTPVVSAKITDNGTVDPQSIILKINSNPVTTTYDPATGIVSHIPTSPLGAGTYSVYLEARDQDGNLNTASWVFKVDFDTAGPVLGNFSPANGADSATASPVISFTVTDQNQLDEASVKVKVAGVSLPVSISYPSVGHYETQADSCTGEPIQIWVIDGYDYTRATVTARATNVPDIAGVWVQAGDKLGNVTTAEWSFRAMVPPTVTDMKPANGTYAPSNLPTVSAKITDYGLLNFASIVLKINNSVVNHTYSATGSSACTVSYTCPQPLPPGTYNVGLEARDMAGNTRSVSWMFYVRGSSATFTELQPADGATVSGSNPDIKLKITDTANLNQSTLVVMVNGQRVSASMTFAQLGHYETRADSCTGEPIQVWVIDGYDYTKGNVLAKTSGLPDGVNTVTVSITNTVGGTASYSWSFHVKVPPQLSQPTPANQASVPNTQPLISAKVTDNGTIQNWQMTVNGAQVPAVYDRTTGIISYTPPTPLAVNADCSVQVTATDAVGASASLSWRFRVQGYPDMQFAGKCTECHLGYPAPNHPMTNCDGCHGNNQPVSDCAGCHGYWIHPAEYIGAFGCDYCHSAQFGYKIPLHPADNDGYHNTTTPMDNCQACHRKSLTQEHAQRSDDFGNKLSCNTCHASSKAAVQNAIANRQKNCDACHGIAEHETVHATGVLDANCTTCHVNSLTQEHLSNAVTQTDSATGKLKPWSCGTCHSSANINVAGSVYTGNKQCASCHSRAHEMAIAETVMSDIPLYDGFNWTTPMNAALWEGESWMPQEFLTGGKVIMSNRRPDVSGSAVYAFYAGRLTAGGWSAGSAPASETNFSVTFTKGKHRVVVRYDLNTAAGGARIVIIYM